MYIAGLKRDELLYASDVMGMYFRCCLARLAEKHIGRYIPSLHIINYGHDPAYEEYRALKGFEDLDGCISSLLDDVTMHVGRHADNKVINIIAFLRRYLKPDLFTHVNNTDAVGFLMASVTLLTSDDMIRYRSAVDELSNIARINRPDIFCRRSGDVYIFETYVSDVYLKTAIGCDRFFEWVDSSIVDLDPYTRLCIDRDGRVFDAISLRECSLRAFRRDDLHILSTILISIRSSAPKAIKSIIRKVLDIISLKDEGGLALIFYNGNSVQKYRDMELAFEVMG